ncbi:hypothetical protein C8Q80DRAFT_236903 [Daedaleopsis nitida]|nr:hypothetical protein C8Q80DRAFT_236903 [Daedaleopsis nitida]
MAASHPPTSLYIYSILSLKTLVALLIAIVLCFYRKITLAECSTSAVSDPMSLPSYDANGRDTHCSGSNDWNALQILQNRHSGKHF